MVAQASRRERRFGVRLGRMDTELRLALAA
jgi:hypothetical protein